MSKALITILFVSVGLTPSAEEIEELIVRANASIDETQLAGTAYSRVDKDALERLQAAHPNELFNRVPGTWVTRNSGQEHLTAIRSGVLTGAGACGAFLLLENGVPVRPSGFCNVNGLFEVNTEQAYAVEVVRGPASSRYGGNALHGVVNAITLYPELDTGVSVSLGSNSWQRLSASAEVAEVKLVGHATQAGGYRENTGHDQQKLLIQHSKSYTGGDVSATLSMTNLSQETGGYVRGIHAYRDSALRRSNPNPEAYRNAKSTRLAVHMARSNYTIVPYLRQSSMEFLQHFLPGQPLEENNQTSGGVTGRWQKEGSKAVYALGGQIEWMSAGLTQMQTAATEGSAFLVATRPVGTHYDYDVDSSSFAIYHDLLWRVSGQTEILHRLRLERLQYAYDNRFLDGNTRDDGTACGFGGCLYTRPADREDSFTNLAGNIGVRHHLSDSVDIHSLVAVGFRPPQVNELYRLQSGQTVADLHSERLRSVEVGLEADVESMTVSLVLYSEEKMDAIFRDAEGMNVSDGHTKARGLEFALARNLAPQHKLTLTGSLARHTYEFTSDASRGERFIKGNEVDSAPKALMSAYWNYQPSEKLESELEMVKVGSHAIDAANTAHYGGHTIYNWRARWNMDNQWRLQLRINNLTNKRFADRGDYAFGSYRYFPGPSRQFFVDIAFTAIPSAGL